MVLVEVNKGVPVRETSILSGHKAIRKVYTGRRVIKMCVHDISAEPEDYDGREAGRNPVMIKYVHNLRGE